MSIETNDIVANGRHYKRPSKPVVVACIDGSEPAYIEEAITAGIAPNLERLMKTGTNVTAHSVIPSFTNPNNLSIITGRPPAVHGIAGNYFYDREAGAEVMMNDARFLRAPTILAAFQQAGCKVAMVTAKNKLHALLSNGLDFSKGTAIAFSSEKADTATIAQNGIENVLNFVGMPLPDVYSAKLSEFVFAAGVQLLKSFRPDVMYLSTTDFVQHTAAPGSEAANDFYAMLDRYVGELDAAGCTLLLTADHGMNDKHRQNGEPDVIYLQQILDSAIGAGASRVILPITDPYVGHHGALGSFATIYADENIRPQIVNILKNTEGVDEVLLAEEACARFELPADRIGDIVVLSSRYKVLGTDEEHHDLSQLTAPLRSHGGLTEQVVPVIANRKLTAPANRQLRNFDAFDVALNWLV